MRRQVSQWLVVVALASFLGGAAARADTAEVDTAIDSAFAWLTSERDDLGAWRSEYGPGITGLVATAYLRHPSGRYDGDSPELKAALDWLASLQQEDGSIYDPDSQLPLPNYNPSTALMALSAAKSNSYADVVRRAQDYLMMSQTDEGDGASPEDSNYGGIGYGSDPDVRDLSNLTFALAALQESGVPEDAAVWGKAVQFLERVQNNSETNDQSYASDDGGFIYSPGESKADVDSQGRPRSYSSMTYAGLLSFIYANVSKDDARVQAAHKWLQEHWSMDENYPIGQQGLYYGYHTMAKALSAYGDDTITTSDGETIRWYDALASHLLSLQTPDGFWPPNDADRWYEGDPVLVTAYSLLALEAGYPAP
ncbi:terpene cyclase/mutase family protein [Candidatus Poribacteria bacterium]|nr:terpene cyclase/mutase family protein [Candidatus Poribacteria bacterium]